MCQPLDSVFAVGQCVSLWIVCQPLDSVLAIGQCVSQDYLVTSSRRSRQFLRGRNQAACQPVDSVSLWIVCQPRDSVLVYGQCVSLGIVCQSLDSVLVFGLCVNFWIVCQPLDSVFASGKCVSLWIVCQPLDSVLACGQDVSPDYLVTRRNHIFQELGLYFIILYYIIYRHCRQISRGQSPKEISRPKLYEPLLDKSQGRWGCSPA